MLIINKQPLGVSTLSVCTGIQLATLLASVDGLYLWLALLPIRLRVGAERHELEADHREMRG